MYITGILLRWLILLLVPHYLQSTSEHTLTNLCCDIGLENPPTQRKETTKRIMMMLQKQLSSSQKEAYPPGPPTSLGHSLVILSSLRLLVDERPDSVFIRKCRKLSSKGPNLWKPQQRLGEEAEVVCLPSGGLPGASLGAASESTSRRELGLLGPS